jgi:hypothetical protein
MRTPGLDALLLADSRELLESGEKIAGGDRVHIKSDTSQQTIRHASAA